MAPNTRATVRSPQREPRSPRHRNRGREQHAPARHFQAPETPPSLPSLKRRWAMSTRNSPASKAQRAEIRESIEFDSDGYEYVVPPEIPTPSTVEIYIDTEMPTTPERSRDVGESPVVFDDPQPSDASEYETALTSGSVTSPQTTMSDDEPDIPGHSGGNSVGDEDCAFIPSSWPVTLSPRALPGAYMFGRIREDQIQYGRIHDPKPSPVFSYVPATHLLGPREFDQDHYACPFPSCTKPFGPSEHPDGYRGRSLVKHVYQRHGAGNAVDLMSLGLRQRVISLHHEQGIADPGVSRLPCAWLNPARDLAWVSIGIMQDLEEIRAWECSSRAAAPSFAGGPDSSPATLEVAIQVTEPVMDIAKSLPQRKQDSAQQSWNKGEEQAVASKEKHDTSVPDMVFVREGAVSPSPQAKLLHTPLSANRIGQAAPFRDIHHNQRRCSGPLLHVKRASPSTPTRKQARDALRSGGHLREALLSSPSFRRYVMNNAETLSDDLLELLGRPADYELNEDMEIT